MEEAHEVRLESELRKAQDIVKKYGFDIKENKVDEQTVNEDKINAIKAYDMLTKDINAKIEQEEQGRNFQAASNHRRELHKIKQEWERIEEVNQEHKEEKQRIDEQWEKIQEKRQDEKTKIDEQWDQFEQEKIRKAKEAKAPKTCNSVDFQKAKKLKEKHDRREQALDRREDSLQKQRNFINEAKQDLESRERNLNVR